MSFIFNIKRANAEIARLAAENAEQANRIKELTESTPEALAQAEASLAESNGNLQKLAVELNEAKDTIAKLTTERDAAMAAKEEALKQVASEASKKAAEIVAQQGANAVATDPKSTGNPAEQLAQISDPTERARFIRAHRSELFKAEPSPLKR